ncbi:MAG: ATP-dependent DNA ligase, partial [Candidatus Omnitrophica bacterium]|nr:ATP-dependent DNA ligase [Candidatus Omnitrophota bacterium]
IRAIENFKVIVGCPIRMALAARLSGPREIIEKVGTCAIEAKYDGFRCQVHKKGDQVHIFSRNLENTTAMFPEIREGTLRQIKEKNVIFEGEAIAIDPDTGENLPFQTTVQRKRKYDIEMMQSRLPLKLFVFDILYAGEDLTQHPFEQRRRILADVVNPGEVLEISPVTIADNAEQVEKLFLQALDEGREGIVAKRIDGGYQAGGRNFNWIKLKRSTSAVLQDTVDCVIVGYFFGKGSRSAFGIGSLLACVYDKDSDRFKTIAKLGSGISEDELTQFKTKLEATKVPVKPGRVDSLIVPDVWVEPKFVVEVRADEITKSPVHTCGKEADNPGFALRFPRTIGFIRSDKSPEDATTVEEIMTMFNLQGRRKNDA